MTTRPRLADFDRGAVAGLAAVALFVIMAGVFLTAQLDKPQGFDAGVNVVKGIGFAMFDIASEDVVASEGFLAAFEIIDIVLVAALVGAVMLARRESEGSFVQTITDGGRPRDEAGDGADEVADETDATGGED